MTKALNGFILGIALISLCTSLLSLSENQLKQLVIFKNLGVTHTQLLWLKLTQTAVWWVLLQYLRCRWGLHWGCFVEICDAHCFGWTIIFLWFTHAAYYVCDSHYYLCLCAYLPIRK